MIQAFDLQSENNSVSKKQLLNYVKIALKTIDQKSGP